MQALGVALYDPCYNSKIPIDFLMILYHNETLCLLYSVLVYILAIVLIKPNIFLPR
jgi:hypothetical protein